LNLGLTIQINLWTNPPAPQKQTKNPGADILVYISSKCIFLSLPFVELIVGSPRAILDHEDRVHTLDWGNSEVEKSQSFWHEIHISIIHYT
jgi:hypothetical protein